ncbi:MAG: extracellular solute-binding protein [Desulfitobacterium hafniense]|nr:extracellular solute-binding protein [Desulfitobacterium hafniense]
MQKGLKRLLSVTIIAALLLTGCGYYASLSSRSSGKLEPVTLNIATAGDIDMMELQEKAVGKEFSQKYSDVVINVVGTGPGDSGSREIFAKLKAQKEENKKVWDIDVAIVHQSIMKEMMKEGLLEKYVPMSQNKKYVTSADSVNSLGIDVDDYVIPMFHNQVVLAYNPEQVKEVPYTFEQLVKWIQAHPRRFGYNGISNDMSGAAFVTAYTYWKSEDYKQLTEGPYDPKLEKKWPSILKELKALPVIYTSGTEGTLDMLNRGDIDMGPVWVDMFSDWKAEGRMNLDLKMTVIAPGLPGQTMYVVIPKKAQNKEIAIKYADFLTSPEVQARVIVERNGWYPGIDANVTLAKVSEQGKTRLFSDITTEDLGKKSQSFPLQDYFNKLQIAYEKS